MVHRHLLEPRQLPTPANCSLRKPRPKTRQLRQLWLCAAPPVNNAQAAQAAKLRRTAQECGILGQSVRLCTWQFPFHQRPLPPDSLDLDWQCIPKLPARPHRSFQSGKGIVAAFLQYLSSARMEPIIFRTLPALSLVFASGFGSACAYHLITKHSECHSHSPCSQPSDPRLWLSALNGVRQEPEQHHKTVEEFIDTGWVCCLCDPQ